MRAHLLAAVAVAGCLAKPPNIILLVADDLGYADVGFQGSNFPTPRIDALAASGTVLERMYVNAICSPTRSALLTGRYSFKTGMQHLGTIYTGSPAAVPRTAAMLPELLGGIGYETHMIGKWHLGASQPGNTPMRRGFSSYLGYMQGQTEYYNESMTSATAYPDNAGSGMWPGAQNGEAYDFWDGEEPAYGLFGQYTGDSYMARYQDILAARNASGSDRAPFFLYYAEQNVHVPLELPPDPKHEANCAGVVSNPAGPNRTVLCAMASQLDETVGQVEDLLRSYGEWDDTLIWFVSDNGGMTAWGNRPIASASSNYPLRGGKSTLFEGGVRAVSFMAGGALASGALGTTRQTLLHAVDVVPTLLAAASVPGLLPEGADGVDAFALLSSPAAAGENVTALRTEIPINVDTNPLSPVGHKPGARVGTANYSALIQWPYKFILGSAVNPLIGSSSDGWWTTDPYVRVPPTAAANGADTGFWLFNLEDDEAETTDLSAANPAIVESMTARLVYLADPSSGYKASQLNYPLAEGDPSQFNWTWAPFR